MMLGLEYENDYGKQRRTLNDWAVQPYIWVGALIGLLVGWIRSRKMLVFGIMATYGMLTYVDPTTMKAIHYLGPFYVLFDSRPSWTMYRAIIPILSAYGYFMIGDLLLWVVDKIHSYLPRFFKFNWHALVRPLLVTAAFLGIVGYTFYYFPNPRNISKAQQVPWIKRIGYVYWDLRNIWMDHKLEAPIHPEINYEAIPKSAYYDRNILLNQCGNNKATIPNRDEICMTLIREHKELTLTQINGVKKYCNSVTAAYNSPTYLFCNSFYYELYDQLRLNRFPPVEVLNKKVAPVVKEEDKQIFAFMPQDPLKTRFDYSGLGGTSIMRAPLLTDLSEIQVYINTLTLFSALWNYQSSVMYAIQPIYQQPGKITQLAQYYGFEYIDGTTQGTPPEVYEGDPNLEKLENSNWWRFKKPTTLTTWTTKPSLLFVGDQQHYFYDQAFKIFNLKALPYEEAISFNSDIEYIDDLNPEYIKKFDALFLEGYKYHNKDKGHQLITDYVKQGGNVFIETGWEYKNPDYKLDRTPPFFPTNQTVWQQMGARANMVLDNTNIIDYNPQTRSIGFLTLPNGRWAVSAPQDLRKNAKVILQSNGVPLLVAYKYGQGKVLWSGFNIVPHIEGGKNENVKELEVLQHSLKWLLSNDETIDGENTKSENLKITVQRPNPDKVQFTFNETTDKITTLYWREAYYNKWKAELSTPGQSQTLAITMAGPRMMGIRIPPIKQGSQLTLQIVQTPRELMMKTIGILTEILLLAYLFNLTKPVESLLRRKVYGVIRRTKRSLRKASEMSSTYKMHEDPDEHVEEVEKQIEEKN
jgi:hypothetical protein